jgi:hypothetical protein
MRTYLIMKEKAEQFKADAEIQGLLAKIGADDGSMDEFKGAYTAGKAAALKAHAFDRQALGARGMQYEVTRQVGPRIIGLALRGGDNVLAELPGVTLECPGSGDFSLYGGHRLWYAPEDPRRTYLPDDEPVTIEEVDRGVRVTQPVEAETGIQKSLTITLPGNDARVVIDHTVSNRGPRAMELAAWAITQVRPGGTAVLPQATEPVDELGVLPNRQFALWPYTPINSPHITWGDRYVFIQATMESGALKIGFPNPAGWLGYAVGDTLLVKHAPYEPGAVYFDRGSSSECYCNPRFLELETLGPRTFLEPGGSVTHRETWTLHAGVAFQAKETAVDRLVAELGLATGEASP